MEEKIKSLTYRFRFGNGQEKEFTVRLRFPSMRQELAPRAWLPDWTRLENQQCPNCPLKPEQSPHCPAAASLVDVIESFKDVLSYENVELTIATEEREYRATRDLQRGLSGLVGLKMATSGCPILDRLRPMVFTHLPFATSDETTYRAIAMYLVAQFLRQRRGLSADFELKDLPRLYEDVTAVNAAFVKRLHALQVKDASLNAIVTLDAFGAMTRFLLGKKSLDKLEALFESYLRS